MLLKYYKPMIFYDLQIFLPELQLVGCTQG